MLRVALALLLALLTASAAAQVPEGRLAGVLGANKIDLVPQYLGTASNGNGMLPVLR